MKEEQVGLNTEPMSMVEAVRAKYTKSIYKGEYTPEEILIQEVELYTDITRALSEELVEYESFEHHSVPIVLTIAYKETQTRDELNDALNKLEEIIADAKVLGFSVH